MKQICEKWKCTGCEACINSCPHKCIRLVENEYGWGYPVIDETKCIKCNRCVKICPSVNLPMLNLPQRVFAAIAKNTYDYKTTTSGGVATVFAKKIISEKGTVYGAVMNKDLNVFHCSITNFDDVELLKGSKYVQSSIGKSYQLIKKDLKQGKPVLFIGTPCQCAGLRNYLGDTQSERLYICDIICHGVPNSKMLKDHLKYVLENQKIDKVTFRDTEGFYLSAFYDEKCIYRKRNYFDLFYLGFLKGLFYRESCYFCQYATSKRIGDVTLGDFWGFNTQKGEFPKKHDNGLSVVLINTEKGHRLFSSCRESLSFIERDYEEAVAGNKQLRHPAVRHKNWKIFQKQYLISGFEIAADRALWKEKIKYYILAKVGQ